MMNLRTLTAFLFLFCYSFASFSQRCTSDSVYLYPSSDVSYSNTGFADPNALPCIQSGSYAELLIPFRTYNQGARLLTLADSSTVPVPHIYSIKVESISNLPAGLCWTIRQSGQTISGNDVGVIIIKGTTSASSGAYPLSVSLSLATQSPGSFNYTGMLPASYQALLGQAVLKIQGADGVCPTY